MKLTLDFSNQAGRGTVKPHSGFNANNDAEVLFKAMKGFGEFDKHIRCQF